MKRKNAVLLPSPPWIDICSPRSEKAMELIKDIEPQRSQVSLLFDKSQKLVLKIQSIPLNHTVEATV